MSTVPKINKELTIQWNPLERATCKRYFWLLPGPNQYELVQGITRL